VITEDVWRKAPPAARARLDVVGSVRGIAYADGEIPAVMVVRQKPRPGPAN
jgi:hypothetical protein